MSEFALRLNVKRLQEELVAATRRAEWFEYQLQIRVEAAKELHNTCCTASLIELSKLKSLPKFRKGAFKKFAMCRLLAEQVMDPDDS